MGGKEVGLGEGDDRTTMMKKRTSDLMVRTLRTFDAGAADDEVWVVVRRLEWFGYYPERRKRFDCGWWR